LNFGSKRDLLLGVGLGAVLGFCGFFGPALVQDLRSGQAPTASTFADAVEGCGALELCLLGFFGAVVGYLSRAPFWLIGLATVSLLPVWSLVDMQLAYEGVERHNLLPLEWAFFAIYSLPGMPGAWLSQRALRGPGD